MPDLKTKQFVCKCGYTEDGKGYSIKQKETEQVEVNVVEDTNMNPLTDNQCPKCGHLKAHFWCVQMRGADEAETRFFQCEQCKYTWREK